MDSAVIVPDASVLLKWTLSSNEEDGDRALALRDAWLSGACEILVPSLWIYEVGNILGMKQAAAADTLLQAMNDLHMSEASPSTYASHVFGLMRRFKVTFYDAAYHALAIQQKGVMLTADAAYVRRTSRAGHVLLLKNWTPHLLA
jgi:predicted nucleic acid-binding protein